MQFDSDIENARMVGYQPIHSPYDGHEIGRVGYVDGAGVERALGRADELFQDRGQWLNAAQREAILLTAARLLDERQESLVAAAIAEGGKPDTDTRIELARAVDGLNECARCIRQLHGQEIPMSLNAATEHRLAFTHFQPVGPAVAVSAFNHPINLIVHQAGPAIAAGCPVIVKPAEATPLSAFLLAEIFHDAGLPQGWLQTLLTENHEVTGQLITDPRVAFFSFIGSARVGWSLRAKLSPGTRCALEHGGIAPVIVAADADLDQAIPKLLKGGFYHAGQVCVSVQRIYAERKIARVLAERLAEAANALTVGDPAKPETEVGPLIRTGEVSRVHEWVGEALNQGAELLTGGEKLSNRCYRPTVLFEPSPDSRVSRAEIFGPVVCVNSFDSIGQAVSRANASPFAFQAAVMTRNLDAALYAYKHLAAATVMINDHTAFRADWMPFAGLKQSGYGVGGIPYTFKDLHFEKQAVFYSEVW